MKHIFTNAKLVLPDEIRFGSVILENGVISAIDTGTSRSTEGIDCEGEYLLPGLVDIHSDNIEKHIAPRPNVVWPNTFAAIAHDADVIGVGVTTVLDAVSLSGSSKGIDRAEIANAIIRGIEAAARKRALRADHLFHIRCEITDPQIVDRFRGLGDQFPLRMVSLVDHTPGQRVFSNIDIWRDYRKKGMGLSDAELDATLAAELDARQKYAVPNREALAAIARSRNLPLAGHDDATEADVAESASLGCTLAEFPTTLDAARSAKRSGQHVIMGAPNLVRGGSHIGNVSTERCAREGVLDVLASDYMPVSLLHAAFLLTEDPIALSLPQAMATVTSTPAAAVRLEDRGQIAIGKIGDLIRVSHVDAVPVVRSVWRSGARVH